MEKAFFNDWELWQKMTFVLGACIFIVFCIAYGKLVWMNKYVRRQEIIDEEKRARIQQLRQSGQFIESPKTHDIPFGVRAIQSGVQVDGIWISNTTTPVPHEITPDRVSGISADSVPESKTIKGPVLAIDGRSSSSPNATRFTTGRGRSPFEISESGSSFIEHIDEAHKSDSTSNRNSYQPRKSSQLRYDSHGAYHDKTLGQLEGKSSYKKTIQAHRPRGSRRVYAEAESSAADNERNSGTSSDSDATSLEGNLIEGPSRAGVISVPMQSHPEYSVVPTESPFSEISDPFASPMEIALSSQQPHSHGDPASSITGTSIDKTQQSYPHTPFVPGGLHANNSIRKVNSGFEVLPAGTFTSPSSYKGKAVDYGARINEIQERQPQKLQKKGRYSSTVDRHLNDD